MNQKKEDCGNIHSLKYKSCFGKKHYHSKKDALLAAQISLESFSSLSSYKHMGIYRCDFCYKYHMTKNIDAKNPKLVVSRLYESEFSELMSEIDNLSQDSSSDLINLAIFCLKEFITKVPKRSLRVNVAMQALKRLQGYLNANKVCIT